MVEKGFADRTNTGAKNRFGKPESKVARDS